MIKITEKDYYEFGELCGSYYVIERDGEHVEVLWTDCEVSLWLQNNVLPDEFVEWSN